MRLHGLSVLTALVCFGLARVATAQVTPAAGYVPPDDTPSIRVGATIFLDYTVQPEPKVTDADGNTVTGNAFNIGRAYVNVTGQIVAFDDRRRAQPHDCRRRVLVSTAGPGLGGNPARLRAGRNNDDYTPVRADERRWAVHMLINF